MIDQNSEGYLYSKGWLKCNDYMWMHPKISYQCDFKTALLVQEHQETKKVQASISYRIKEWLKCLLGN